MKYTILIERYAIKQISKLDKKEIPKIKNAIAKLADNPRPQGYKNSKMKMPIGYALATIGLSMKLMIKLF